MQHELCLICDGSDESKYFVRFINVAGIPYPSFTSNLYEARVFLNLAEAEESLTNIQHYHDYASAFIGRFIRMVIKNNNSPKEK